MKKQILLLMLAIFAISCTPEKDDDDESLTLALLLASQTTTPTCSISVSLGSRTSTVSTPITAFSASEVGRAKSISKTRVAATGIDHEIGVVSLTAQAGSKLTFVGQHYVIVYKKLAGCPIGTEDIATVNTSYSHSSAVSSNSVLANSNLVAAANVVTFNETGNFFVVVYTGVTFPATTTVSATLTAF